MNDEDIECQRAHIKCKINISLIMCMEYCDYQIYDYVVYNFWIYLSFINKRLSYVFFE